MKQPAKYWTALIDINELRRLAQAATPGPWIAKKVSGAGLEIHMSHPAYPGKEWPAFGTGAAFCKKGLVSYETWAQFPNEVRDAQQATNAEFIAAANPVAISELLDRLEVAEEERDDVAQQLVQSEQGKRKISEECDALRTKIEQMERQEPAMWANSSNIVSARINQERGTVGDQHTCAETKTAYHDAPLYALPGVKGE